MAKVGTFTAEGDTLLDFLRGQSQVAGDKKCASWCIREKVSELDFIPGVKKIGQAEGLWEKGRFFNNKLEIRWQKHDDKYYKAFVLTEDELPALPEGLEYSQNPKEKTMNWEVIKGNDIELWGEYNEKCNGFIEVRIPHVLPYPVEAKARDNVSIGSIHYKLNGVIVLTRFTEVKSKDGRT